MELKTFISLRQGAWSAELYEEDKQLFIKLINAPNLIPLDEYLAISQMTGLLDNLPNTELQETYKHLRVDQTSLRPIYQFAGIEPITAKDLADYVRIVQNMPSPDARLVMIAKDKFYRHLSTRILADVTGLARQTVHRQYNKKLQHWGYEREPLAIMVRKGVIRAFPYGVDKSIADEENSDE